MRELITNISSMEVENRKNYLTVFTISRHLRCISHSANGIIELTLYKVTKTNGI